MDPNKTLNDRLNDFLEKVKKQDQIIYRCLSDVTFVNQEAAEFKDAVKFRQKLIDRIMDLKDLWD